MLTECSHIYDDAHKCRRIPRRGDRFCPAHRANPSAPRRAGAEDAAFDRGMETYVLYLQALPPDELLDDAAVALSTLFPAIHTRLSRRNRVLFSRASVAAALASEAVAHFKLAQATRHIDHPPVPASRPPAPGSQLRTPRPMPPDPGSLRLAPNSQPQAPISKLKGATRAEFERLLGICRSNPSMSPDELDDIIHEAQSLLESDAEPLTPADSNRWPRSHGPKPKALLNLMPSP